MQQQNQAVTLIFNVLPIPKGRPIFGRGITFTPKRTRDAEKELKWLMKEAWRQEPLSGALSVEMIFSLPRPKSAKKRMYPSVKCGDLDNLVKLVGDSANDIIWVDDSQIVELSARKEYGLPFIQLVVREI